MSKSETIDALMESALYMFSRDGYEGASLRDIARIANVPLSTIHLYFGSKWDLFTAARRKAWDEVDQERTILFERAVSRNNTESPPLDALIYALAFPIVRRALSGLDRDTAQIYILRSHLGQWPLRLKREMLEVADRSMSRWIDAIQRICPALSYEDTVWAFSFVVGTVYSWQVIDRRYDTLLGGDANRDAEEVTSDIVAFCSGGILSVAAHRSALRQRT